MDESSPEREATGQSREATTPEQDAASTGRDATTTVGEAKGSDRDADPSGVAFSRRDLLRTGVGVGIASATAGCAGGVDVGRISTYRFDAAPVFLAPDPRGVSYREVASAEETVERNPTVGGVGVGVELTNHARVYESDEDSLGLLSSPAATVATRPVNPLATDALREILVGDVGARVLKSLGVVDQPSVTWARGPEQVGTGEGELLGQSTAITSFAGVTEQSGFVLVTVARVTDAGDVVFAANALERDGDAGQLVGEEGYVGRETVRGSVDRLAGVLPRVEREVTGLRLAESTQLEPEAGAPGYARVVLENTADERPAHASTLVAQFFDAEGALVDAGTAAVPALGPGETFEGYLPYFADGVAGYAVEAEPSTRETPGELPDGVEIASDAREGDTVTAVVRNTTGETAPFVDLAVTFYGENGNVLGTRHRHVEDLEEGERREFRTAYAPATTDPSVTVGDYAVDLVRFDDSVLYVR